MDYPRLGTFVRLAVVVCHLSSYCFADLLGTAAQLFTFANSPIGQSVIQGVQGIDWMRTPALVSADPKNPRLASFSEAPKLSDPKLAERTLSGQDMLAKLEAFIKANETNRDEAIKAQGMAAQARVTMDRELTSLQSSGVPTAADQPRIDELKALLKPGGPQDQVDKVLKDRKEAFEKNIAEGNAMKAQVQQSIQATCGGGCQGGGGGGGGGGKGGGALLAVAALAAVGGAAAAMMANQSTGHDDSTKKNEDEAAAKRTAQEAESRGMAEAQFKAQVIQRDQLTRAADSDAIRSLLELQLNEESKQKRKPTASPTPSALPLVSQKVVVTQATSVPLANHQPTAPQPAVPHTTLGIGTGQGRTSPLVLAAPVRTLTSRGALGLANELSSECEPPKARCFDKRGQEVACRSRRAVRFVKPAPAAKQAAASSEANCRPSQPLSMTTP